MKRLKRVLDNVIALDANKVMQKALSLRLVQEEIVRLNTDEQLFERGINAEGVELADIGGDYAEVTVLLKKEESLPFDRVTLFDTGEFYSSFYVKVFDTYFEIVADTIKDGEDLQNRWGDELLGLTDESRKALKYLLLNEGILKEIILAEILK